MNARSPLGRLVLAGVLWHWCAMLYADGGAVRCSERRGDYRITVFTSPTPLRAGPVDISVFVQDVATRRASAGSADPGASDAARSWRRNALSSAPQRRRRRTSSTRRPSSTCPNRAGGTWRSSIEGLREPIKVSFAMEADKPPPQVWEMTPWIAWPALVMVLFGVHQWLVRRKLRRPSAQAAQRSKRSGQPLTPLRSVRGSDKKSGCHSGWERDNRLFGNASAQRR